LITQVKIGGIVGAHNSGKSAFLQKSFGFDTNPGLVHEKRTFDPTPYFMKDLENVALVDFPGSDEIVINKNNIKFMMEACNCFLIMSTYEQGFSEHIGELIGLARRRRIPCIVCFNKSDVVWKDCRKKKRKDFKGKKISKEELTKEIATYFVQQTKEMEEVYKKNAPMTTLWFTCFQKKAMKRIILPDNPNFIKDVDEVKKWLAETLIDKPEELLKIKPECSSDSDDSDS